MSWMGRGLAIFEWHAWDHFLISQLFPQSKSVSIDPFSEKDWNQCIDALDETEAVLFQINLAQTDFAPPFRQRLRTILSERGVCVLNEDVTDLRKRQLQRCLGRYGLRSALASLDGLPEERLIVKTDLNHGGLHERKVAVDCLVSLGLDLPPQLSIDAKSYPVLMRKEIPADWYQDKGLVFERYISNAQDRFHRAYIAGEHVIISQAHAEGHIKKLQNDPRDVNYFFFREELTGEEPLVDCGGLEPADILKQLGRFLSVTRIDYAAIDIVNDGRASYIIDVNTTPWAGEAVPNSEAMQFLRLGIHRRMTECRDSVANGGGRADKLCIL